MLKPPRMLDQKFSKTICAMFVLFQMAIKPKRKSFLKAHLITLKDLKITKLSMTLKRKSRQNLKGLDIVLTPILEMQTIKFHWESMTKNLKDILLVLNVTTPPMSPRTQSWSVMCSAQPSSKHVAGTS